MDNIDAPQWADLIGASPQVSDDFFSQKHEAHEYRSKCGSVDSDLSLHSKQSSNESYANDNIFDKTPLKPKYSKGKSSSCKKNNVKETTYESALSEAMNNLQLSFKKLKGDKSLNKTCLMDSPTTFKTPLRVTRSMCANKSFNTPRCDLDESHYVSLEQDSSDEDNEQGHEKNKKNIDNDKVKLYDKNDEKIEHECENSINEETSQINLEFTGTSTEHEISNEKQEIESELQTITQLEQDVETQAKSHQDEINKDNGNKPLTKSKVVTSFNVEGKVSANSKKKVATLTGTAWHRQMKRRMSITNHRLSIHKNPTGNKYVSMAEAVTKFQRATPQRFRTTTVKPTRTEILRRQSFKLTKATSPALMCKKRARPVTAISREEQERLELEKIRHNQIKANPVRKDILKKPAPLKKVEKKVITNPEPFHLTQVKKQQTSQKMDQNVKKPNRLHTKRVPTIVSTNEKSVIIKEVEVLHFGIPLEPVNMKKKTTKVKPFSFEARNRELQMKKQEKLKQLKESEKEKQKVEFHARPVPVAVKTPNYTKLPQKAASADKPKKITIARSLSFEERHKELQKKKEEKIKHLLDEEKKARNFKAQKVPEFKPVLVRGRSRDNLLKKSTENLSVKPQNTSGSLKKNENVMKKSHENLTTKGLIKKPLIPFVAAKKVSSPSSATENQENKHQGAVPKILEPKCKLSQKSVAVLSELNTDKRAKERKEFEEQMKKKESDIEEMRKKEEQERLEREKVENLELRKKMEVRARPMPKFKPMNIIKSTKPLTEAQSPLWAKRNGSMH